MTDGPRFDLIVVDGGARTFPAVLNSISLRRPGWIMFLPAIGNDEPSISAPPRITLPALRVHEILHNRVMPKGDDERT